MEIVVHVSEPAKMTKLFGDPLTTAFEEYDSALERTVAHFSANAAAADAKLSTAMPEPLRKVAQSDARAVDLLIKLDKTSYRISCSPATIPKLDKILHQLHWCDDMTATYGQCRRDKETEHEKFAELEYAVGLAKYEIENSPSKKPPERPVSKQRNIVYGTLISEAVTLFKQDAAGGIIDYASSKPYFREWFERHRADGNVHAEHVIKRAPIGHIVDMRFDDFHKRIDVAVEITDPQEWKKIEDGVYTGFSVGINTIKHWRHWNAFRATVAPTEISLVAEPANPEAIFRAPWRLP
jgi:hypothetical protein